MPVQKGDGASPSIVNSEGICIAFGSNWNDFNSDGSSPLWARIDDPSVPPLTHIGAGLQARTNSVVHWETHRGRSYELSKTQAGTASIKVVDKTGLFDPTLNGPYQDGLKPMKPAKISIQNPHNGEFYDVFTGYVDSYQYALDTTERWMEVTINLIDGFDILSRFEGDPDQSGYINLPGQQVDDRMYMVLRDFTSWNMEQTSIFTGNVALQPIAYQPGTAVLAMCQDAADAEFPYVANCYIDKHGNFSFRGRFARFDYTNPDYNVNQWTVGDISYTHTFGGAPIAAIEWNLDSRNLINACLTYPRLMAQAEIYQLQQLASDFPLDSADPSSISHYGPRAYTIPDLVIAYDNYFWNYVDGSAYSQATGRQMCELFSAYYVTNYSAPQNRISRLEFHSRLPGNSEWWAFICGVEIGDVLTVNTSDPGGGGFVSDKFFVEGISFSADPLRSDFPALTVNFDVSPVFWYGSFPGYTPGQPSPQPWQLPI